MNNYTQEQIYKLNSVNEKLNICSDLSIPKNKNIIFGLDDEIPIVSYVIHSTKEIFKKKILK